TQKNWKAYLAQWTGERLKPLLRETRRSVQKEEPVMVDPQVVIVPVASRKPSAISQALRALSEPDAHEASAWNMGSELDRSGYRIRVASDRATRERAYRLAQRIYRQRGYLPSKAPALCVAAYDARPDTLTLLMRDAQGRDLGTLSVI